uniref:Uncharacterized protein n=1 Tax=Arundo donax TaxID=35708 RepID=A0A0A9BCF7_ARUDO
MRCAFLPTAKERLASSTAATLWVALMRVSTQRIVNPGFRIPCT